MRGVFQCFGGQKKLKFFFLKYFSNRIEKLHKMAFIFFFIFFLKKLEKVGKTGIIPKKISLRCNPSERVCLFNVYEEIQSMWLSDFWYVWRMSILQRLIRPNLGSAFSLDTYLIITFVLYSCFLLRTISASRKNLCKVLLMKQKWKKKMHDSNGKFRNFLTFRQIGILLANHMWHIIDIGM